MGEKRWLNQMCGLTPVDRRRLGSCNSPHLAEVTHRHPADNVNCVCFCHTAEAADTPSLASTSLAPDRAGAVPTLDSSTSMSPQEKP